MLLAAGLAAVQSDINQTQFFSLKLITLILTLILASLRPRCEVQNLVEGQGACLDDYVQNAGAGAGAGAVAAIL
jgi:hypothetical protein